MWILECNAVVRLTKVHTFLKQGQPILYDADMIRCTSVSPWNFNQTSTCTLKKKKETDNSSLSLSIIHYHSHIDFFSPFCARRVWIWSLVKEFMVHHTIKRIRKLKIIVYHKNLHYWYKWHTWVVYRYYWKMYLSGKVENVVCEKMKKIQYPNNIFS